MKLKKLLLFITLMMPIGSFAQGEEKTGYDIAKYIVASNIKIKEGFKIHSANPIGRYNISQLLTHYGYQELS